jgi:hypothetical protein
MIDRLIEFHSFSYSEEVFPSEFLPTCIPSIIPLPSYDDESSNYRCCVEYVYLYVQPTPLPL